MSMNTFRTTMRTSAWNADDVREDDDIISMVVIMKDEKLPNGRPMQTLQSSMVAASDAMLALFNSTGTLGDTYDGLLKSWVDGRIRKVVKHAKPAKFHDIRKLLDDRGVPYGYADVDGSSALVLCPLRASTQHEEWFKPIHKLQLQGYHAPSSSVCDASASSCLIVTVNNGLGMSDGKMIAQLMHAVQVAVCDLDDDEYDAWKHGGFNIYPCLGKPSQEDSIIIHDAGFTEIPPDSFTASALVV